jgi:hypothetical protein
MRARIFFALMASALGCAAAQTDVVSDWSPASNGISLRISCPGSLVAGSQNKLFWIKCEIRNEGSEALWITNRARFFLTDDQGTTARCRRVVIGTDATGRESFDYRRLVGAKQAVTFWESGQMDKPGGRYGLHAVLDNPAVQTPPVRVQIALGQGVDERAAREAAVRERFDSLPEVIPNGGDSLGTFHWVSFAGDPLIVDGGLYYAFRFRAPAEPRNLAWCFICTLREPISWSIVRRTGSMVGFRGFAEVGGEDAVPGLSRATDKAIFVDLAADSLGMGGDYCVCLRPEQGFTKGMMMSFNLSKEDIVQYRPTPQATQERAAREPARPQ